MKLAEKMTGKPIVPASAGTFTDTDSEYARKAYAAGITTGTTATPLAPNAPCTIEQALIVAYRSLDAGSIGWYQCVKSVKGFGHYADLATHYVYGDRVWITSSSGHCTDPYGKPSGVDPRDFYPIKDR